MKTHSLKKIILIIMLSMVSNTLYANENARVMSKVWLRNNGNCSEGYSFSANQNIFAYTASTGKRIMGKYLVEKVLHSDRLKLTLSINGDNRLNDCFSGAYDLFHQTMVYYLSIDTKNNLLRVANGLTDNFWGFYSLASTLSKTDEPIWFNTIYNALLQDMTIIHNNVQRAYNKQQMYKTNTSLSNEDMFSIMDKATQERKNAQAVVDIKLKNTSPEKADQYRQEMIDNNWRRMDARAEQNRIEQIEDNRIQEYNRQEDIRNDYNN